MKRWLSLAILLVAALANAGCLINQYSPDKNVRMEQMLFQAEDLRQIHDEWRRFWMNDQPSHMTYQRVHGGIGP